MKKVFITASVFALSIMFVAIPARAQVVDQNALMIQLTQELITLVDQLNQNFTSQINTLNNRVAALEAQNGGTQSNILGATSVQSVGQNTTSLSAVAQAIVAMGASDNDAVAAAAIINGYDPDSLPRLKTSCVSSAGKARRTTDRAFMLACLYEKF